MRHEWGTVGGVLLGGGAGVGCLACVAVLDGCLSISVAKAIFLAMLPLAARSVRMVLASARCRNFPAGMKGYLNRIPLHRAGQPAGGRTKADVSSCSAVARPGRGALYSSVLLLPGLVSSCLPLVSVALDRAGRRTRENEYARRAIGYRGGYARNGNRSASAPVIARWIRAVGARRLDALPA